MAWEKVIRLQSRTTPTEPEIRITSGREVTISFAALALLDFPARVVLLCDPERQVFALYAAPQEEAEAFVLAGRGSARRFSTVVLSRQFYVAKGRQVFTPRLVDGELHFGPYQRSDAPDPAQVREIVAAAANGRR